MQGVFKVNRLPDKGDFSSGDQAALAWDVLKRVGGHDIPTTIDLSDCVHFKPYALACLAAIGVLGERENRSVRLLPPNDKGCAEHLARLGLHRFFDNDFREVSPRETNFGIRLVRWPPGDAGYEFVRFLASQVPLIPGMESGLVDAVEEVMLNALTHARSPIDCVIVGQAFPASGSVELAAIDLGQTIRGHLIQNSVHATIRSDAEAILKATEEGITGTPEGQLNLHGEPNSGAGLAFIRSFCEGGAGELTILSGRNWVTFGHGIAPVIGSLHMSFTGCIVNIRCFARNDLPQERIYPKMQL